jgi:hypothetical protein
MAPYEASGKMPRRGADWWRQLHDTNRCSLLDKERKVSDWSYLQLLNCLGRYCDRLVSLTTL